jgi:IS1 family transposase
MNKLTTEKRVVVVKALVEGNSLRATSRMTGVAFNTVMKLAVDVGEACADYQDRTLRGLTCKRLQVDEIWSFVYAKQKNVPEEKRAGTFAGRRLAGPGDVWTFVGIDAETKLVPSWRVGLRDFDTAREFMRDLASRLSGPVQLTTDGLKAYLWAVAASFGGEIDYAQLQKIYGAERAGEARYSPPKCVGIRQDVISGDPDPAHISTSYIERQNLTMRMSMRRFTRLTNGFSKKLENHCAAIALHFMHYNFARVHKTLRVTPAMAAGVTDHVWEIEEIVALLDRADDVAA